MNRAAADEAALRAVVVYKWIKGAVQLLLATSLSMALIFGLGDEFQTWSHEFRVHATRAYAVLLAHALETVTSDRGMHVTLAALWLDGVVTCFEGWALNKRHPWGAWLVVAVSGSLLPFELVFLFRRFRWHRLLVLVVNAAVVLFLALHARAQARHLRAQATPADAASPLTPG